MMVLTFFTKAVIAFKNSYVKVIFATVNDKIFVEVTKFQEFF